MRQKKYDIILAKHSASISMTKQLLGLHKSQIVNTHNCAQLPEFRVKIIIYHDWIENINLALY